MDARQKELKNCFSDQNMEKCELTIKPEKKYYHTCNVIQYKRFTISYISEYYKRLLIY